VPKRYRLDYTITLYYGDQQIDEESSSEEYDEEKDAKDAFNRKKDA